LLILILSIQGIVDDIQYEIRKFSVLLIFIFAINIM